MIYESAAIRLENVEKSFPSRQGRVEALRGITADIGDGEFFAIVGPSGCGKTTLLRILAGLEEPTGGTVTIKPAENGRPLNSMVFQEQSIFPWMTVEANVTYGLRMRGIDKKKRDAIAGEYIEKIGLTRFAGSYPHQLSGGMKQRVSVARACANDPEILLMDEPFGALDEQNRIILQQELLRIWEETRKTTVFITHSIDEAICLSDRIMIMTAHPGTVKSVMPIDLPRPRDIASIRTTMRYNRLFQRIWLDLREEVQRVRDREFGRE